MARLVRPAVDGRNIGPMSGGCMSYLRTSVLLSDWLAAIEALDPFQLYLSKAIASTSPPGTVLGLASYLKGWLSCFRIHKASCSR